MANPTDRITERLADLDQLAVECAAPDWDCYGADPVNAQSLEVARRMIRVLPPGLDAPLVAADPDGEVSLSWQSKDGRDLSVSVGPTGRLSYAGLDGPSNIIYGTAHFGDQLPETILELLRRLA